MGGGGARGGGAKLEESKAGKGGVSPSGSSPADLLLLFWPESIKVSSKFSAVGFTSEMLRLQPGEVVTCPPRRGPSRSLPALWL